MQFINYFKATLYGPRVKKDYIGLLVSSIVVGYFVTIIGGAPALISSMVFMCTALMNYYYGNTPNMEAVFPINHKKRLAYRYLSAILMTLYVSAIMLAAASVPFGIVLIIVVSAGEPINFWGGISSIFGSFFTNLGLYGGLFFAAYTIILYSGGMIAGFIKRRKIRNIFLICFCTGVILSVMIMNFVSYAVNGEFFGWGMSAPFANAGYEAMQCPWLSTIFFFSVAFALLGVSIYLGIKRCNPKKF